MQVALVVMALAWYEVADALAGRAARGLTNRFNFEEGRPLLSAVFLIFLLLVGFTLLESFSRAGRSTFRSIMGLPKRPTSLREWALGGAIGWGVAVAAVLPMALAGSLHVRFWMEFRSYLLVLLNLATLLVTALATEMALRGYPFRRLIEAVGPWWATVVMAVLASLVHEINPDASGTSIVVTMIFAILLALAWLRTHGLWLGWGLHFAWNASVAVLFGLPLRGVSDFASVVQTRAVRPGWLTGGAFGPEGAVWTGIVLLIAIVVLVLTTSDYAWDYTRKEIVAAGYEVNPAPPAPHAAMEQESATRPAALVQILPTTPRSPSVDGYSTLE